MTRKYHLSADDAKFNVIKANIDKCCPLCDRSMSFRSSHERLVRSKAQIQLYQKLCFHDACEKCTSMPHGPLCEVCRHMRLSHVVCCGMCGCDTDKPESGTGCRADSCENIQHISHVRLPFGSYDQLQQRSRYCEICSLFAPDVERLKSVYEFDRDDKIYLNVANKCSLLEKVIFGFSITLRVGSLKTGPPDILYHDTADERQWNNMISLDIPAKNINWERVSHWLPDCDINDSADHRDSCHLEPPKYILPSFRVIDTEQQCIIIAPPFCRYATLSYVWGETKGSVQALVSNIKSLEVPGSLTRTGVSLSPVIRDAITACRHLRIRYLWVDQLCILQDEDIAKKALHLNAMGDIYGYSYVTLVDLVGTNADHGLYGVNARQRIRRWSAKVQGLYFLGRSDPFEALVAESKWMTRGWTFQETLLSSRLLLFSDTKLIYECSGRDCVVDDECGRVWPRKRVKIALGSYQDIVHDYTKRTFSFESDILRGFAGILHAGYGSDLPHKI